MPVCRRKKESNYDWVWAAIIALVLGMVIMYLISFTPLVNSQPKKINCERAEDACNFTAGGGGGNALGACAITGGGSAYCPACPTLAACPEATPTPRGCETICADSDRGNDPNTAGFVYYNPDGITYDPQGDRMSFASYAMYTESLYPDSCSDTMHLIEWYCNTNCLPESTEITCSTGCLNGACTTAR